MPLRGLVDNNFLTKLHHGFCGLKALEFGFVTPKQLEISRRIMVKFAGKRRRKKRARVWKRTAAIRPITAKSRGVRMGQGKGNVKYWVAPIKPGKILFEIAKRTRRHRSPILAMVRIQKLMPIKTAVITKFKVGNILYKVDSKVRRIKRLYGLHRWHYAWQINDHRTQRKYLVLFGRKHKPIRT